MKPVEHWFSTCPAQWDDDWDGELRWYQKCYEHWGDRLRVNIGDLGTEGEKEWGRPFGVQFGVDVNLYEETGEFDTEHFNTRRRTNYMSHAVSAIFWRWGIAVSWRGRRIR